MHRDGLFRVKPKDGLDAALVAHIEGQVRPSCAIPRVDRNGERLPPVIPLEVDGLNAAEKELERGRRVAARTRGRESNYIHNILNIRRLLDLAEYCSHECAHAENAAALVHHEPGQPLH